MSPPLLRLLSGNLQNALELGLIESSADAISDYNARLMSSWNYSVSQEDEFLSQMRSVRRSFHRQFRPIQGFRGRTIPFCNVLKMEHFGKYWAKTLRPGPSDDAAEVARTNIERAAVESSTATDESILELRTNFLR